MNPAIHPCLCAVLAAAALFAASPALRADEVKLRDGRVLVGKVTERGDRVEIATRDGTVVVPRAAIESMRTDEQLRTELRNMAGRMPQLPIARLQLAAQARAYGLEPELWQHLDAAVAIPRDDAHQSHRSRVDDFLAQLEPELLDRKWRTADTRSRVHQLLRLQPGNSPGRAAAIEELLVREPNADADLRAQARAAPEPAHRLLALQALQRRGTAGNDRFLLRSAILDRSPEVRSQAIELAQRSGADPAEAVRYLAAGLMHGTSEVRIRTAEALANLGHKDAVKPLVIAGPNAGKSLAAADEGVRAHVAFLNQQAYIRDFDVEVAQAAFIADPQIGILQSGVVLDVTVQGVFEVSRIVKAYRGALQRLAGSDPGPKPAEWATWLGSIAEQLYAPATAPSTGTGVGTAGSSKQR